MPTELPAQEARAAVRALLEVAVRAAARGAVDEARAIAAATATLVDDPTAYTLVGRLAHAQADFDGARMAMAHAVRRFREGNEELAALRTEVASAFTIYDEGNGDEAARLYDDIERRAGALLPKLQPYLLGYRGNLLRQRGDTQAARALYPRAIVAAASNGDRAYAEVFAMDDAIAALLADDVDDAGRILTAVRPRVLALPADLSRAFTLSLVDHYQALAALLRGDPKPGRALPAGLPSLEPVRDVVASGGALRALVHLNVRTEHARISARLLQRVTTVGDARRVVVAKDGGRFVHGERIVDLRPRRPLRRILAHLAASRAAGAGPCSMDALIAAGWPGERVIPSAARNRLHVALSTLRKLGLEGALVHDVDGYALDPATVVVEP